MAGRLWAGFKSYIGHLVAAVLFPLLWWRSLRFAKAEDDPKGRGKVLVGIVAGVVLAAGAAVWLQGFHDDNRAGMYDQLDNRLAQALGESEYQAAIDGMDGNLNTVAVAVKRLNETVVLESQGNVTDAQKARAKELHEEALGILQALQADDGLLRQSRTTKDVDGAAADLRERMGRLADIVDELAPMARQAVAGDSTGPNATAEADAFIANFENTEGRFGRFVGNMSSFSDHHLLYLDVSGAVARQDDAAAKGLIAARTYEHDGLEEGVAEAFAIKDDAYGDMVAVYVWFLVPCVVGLFYAPLVFALGSILKQGFEPSETVGFKVYPSGAMGWFLLLGGFGVPALFFAAWAFKDMEERRLEGQISL